MNEYVEFLTSDKGIKFLSFLGGGVVLVAFGIFKFMKYFGKGVGANDKSIASGRDTNITYNTNEHNKSEE